MRSPTVGEDDGVDRMRIQQRAEILKGAQARCEVAIDLLSFGAARQNAADDCEAGCRVSCERLRKPSRFVVPAGEDHPFLQPISSPLGPPGRTQPTTAKPDAGSAANVCASRRASWFQPAKITRFCSRSTIPGARNIRRKRIRQTVSPATVMVTPRAT